MQNKFPTIEEIAYEEIYGKKRPQSKPHSIKTAHNLRQSTSPHPTRSWSALNVPHRPPIKPSSTVSAVERAAGMHVVKGYVNERNRLIRVQHEKGGVNFCDCGSVMVFEDFVRVKMFLERWGVINCKEELLGDVIGVEQQIERAVGGRADENERGVGSDGQNGDERGVGSDGQNGDDNVKATDANSDLTGSTAKGTNKEQTVESINNFFKENDFTEKKIPPIKTCQCPTTESSYNLKDTTIVCESCLKRGRYPDSISRSDFRSLQDIEPYLTDISDENLLSGVRRYGDDWQRVAQHMNVTKEECVLRFLKKELVGVRDVDVEVLMSSGNRIMSVVSFLCSCVDARVAAVFARSVICDYEKESGVENSREDGAENSREDRAENSREDEAVNSREDGVENSREDGAENSREDRAENSREENKNHESDHVDENNQISSTKYVHDEQNGTTTDKQSVKHSILVTNALAAAQDKAKELLILEQDKMIRLVEVILEAQVKKMELKEEAFTDLKGSFKNERIELMKIREGYKSEIEEIRKEI
ncbi:hypothetical protein VCUG_02072 [Vavraia culicis subsp. floridensis]|uniref:SANT domain-containing protein n=1 Tax=Vavraia culicis (isolate floridensis) TaxID=948595 RepID=L2GS07_VAVCU|nr:uncharacterized protein VCUG_02072 [Vavraia culicis subsp. floridensis]ELA46436.1 hypothetical protein VCUG_02072 [Vavraia culicis subsp. floridensis]